MAEPIGIRQNNPGNIRFGAGFDGEEEGDHGFAAFPDPVAGGRALIKNLVAYSTKHGLNTVDGIINRWAPTSENNTSAYISAVANDLGVQPGDSLNMQDPGTLAKLATAISKHEGNGSVFSGDFFDKLTGGNPELAAYVASQKLPTFTKNQMRQAAYRANPSASGEPDMAVDDMSRIDPVWDVSEGKIEQAAVLQSAEQEARVQSTLGGGWGTLDSPAFKLSAGDIKPHTKSGLSAASKLDAHRHLPMIQGGFGNVLVMLLME